MMCQRHCSTAQPLRAGGRRALALRLHRAERHTIAAGAALCDAAAFVCGEVLRVFVRRAAGPVSSLASRDFNLLREAAPSPANLTRTRINGAE